MSPLVKLTAKHARDMMVRIRNRDGQYLARDPRDWKFSADSAKALVLDYSEDQVAAQLRVIQRACGLTLQVVPVDPREVHETCDQCGCVEAAWVVFFDGRSFLCESCRKRTSLRHDPRKSTLQAVRAKVRPPAS